MKKFSLFLTIILITTSCTKDLDYTKSKIPDVLKDNGKAVNFTIPIEEAIDELNNTLDFIDNQTAEQNGSRSPKLKQRRQVAEIRVIYENMPIVLKASPATNGMRKTSSQKQKDSLLYVVDFANNAGSAVLAADRRIPEKVLAISEEGSFNDAASFRPIYKAGMHIDSEFMKGFSIYNPALDDYYVSNLSCGVLDYIIDYANSYKNKKYTDFEVMGDPPKNEKPEVEVTVITHAWEIKEKILPKLTTIWGQYSPFNDVAPMVNWHPFQSWKLRAPAGCVPIAMAQIMAYHEFPQKYGYDGHTINWKGIKKIGSIYYYNKKEIKHSDSLEIATFVYCLGSWSGAIFTPDWTFTFPGKAKSTMEKMGYKNMYMHKGINKWDKDNHESMIIDMLRKDNPVFIASISKVASGHAWVIDGYMFRVRAIERRFKWGKKEWTHIHDVSEKLVHCNWGWGRFCNGYYAIGIFDMRNGSLASEQGYDNTDPNQAKETDGSNFTWGFHIFSYDNPNK